MRSAIIDIGSSAVKMVIGEKNGDSITILESLKNVIGAGTLSFSKGRISQDVINKTILLLEKYKKVLKEYGVEDVRVIATTAVREASNREVFLDTVRRKTGLDIEVLNVGDVVYYIDAFLSYKLEERYPIHERNLLIAEIGAGSLDISVMEKGFSLMNIGVPIGTMKLKQFKNNLDGSVGEIYEALTEFVNNEVHNLKRALPKIPIDDVILIDESYSPALQCVIPRKKEDEKFFKLRSRDANLFFEKITAGNLDDIAYQYKIPQSIAGAVDGYALILNALFGLIKGRTIHILVASLSEALLTTTIFGVEIGKRYNKTNQLISAAKYLNDKFDVHQRHSRVVVGFAEKLFKEFQATLGLRDEDSLYLTLAGYLHNVGLFISNRSHHKHSEYIINSLSLFRLTEEEIKLIACVARYHRRSAPQKRHLLYGSLSTEQQLLVQKLSALLRLATALDSSRKQKVKDLKVIQKKNQDYVLTAYATGNVLLEKHSFNSKKSLFEEISGSHITINFKGQN